MQRYDQRPAAAAISQDHAKKAYQKLTQTTSSRVESLGGGFSNANFLIDKEYVLRFVCAGQAAAQREATVLKKARGRGLPVPELVACADCCLLTRFVPGLSMDQCPQVDFFHIGRTLAQIHAIPFEEAGFFSPEGQLLPFVGGNDEGLRLLVEFLNGRAGQRLGKPLTHQLLQQAQHHWPAPGPTCLVHCDFNPKNLLFNDDGKVVAILDWEFALAAHPAIDLGNFLRFEEEDFDSAQRQDFSAGYAQAGGWHPADWRQQARMHDLVSLLAFLESPEELPHSFATARNRIQFTLDLMSKSM